MTDIDTAPAAVEAYLALAPTRQRLNPSTYEGEMTAFVTQNVKGAYRVALADSDSLAVGQVIEAKHATRKSSYGLLTVVGAVSTDGKVGEVPEANLPLRLAHVVSPV